MNMKEYCKVQRELIEKYRLECLAEYNLEFFNYICKRLSEHRQDALTDETREILENIIKECLK